MKVLKVEYSQVDAKPPTFGDLPVGAVFRQKNGGHLYMKTRELHVAAGTVNTVGLSGGVVGAHYNFNDTTPVGPLDATLTVAK